MSPQQRKRFADLLIFWRYSVLTEQDRRYVEIVAYVESLIAAEREACAKVCEERYASKGLHPMLRNGAFNCAQLIRARSTPTAEEGKG